MSRAVGARTGANTPETPREKLIIDREDPADASRKIYESAPHNIRAAFCHSQLNRDHTQGGAAANMRAAVWAMLCGAASPDGSPFKPRSADVDEIMDAMTSLLRWSGCKVERRAA